MANYLRRLLALFIAAFILVDGAAHATAAKRLALVIGNQDYDQLTDLTKARNDAQSMEAVLAEDLGFSVISGVDLKRRDMHGKINDLVNSVAKDDVVFFYYSGHGISLGAENYLLPVDLPKPREGEAELVAADSIGVDDISRRILSRGAKAIFSVIDACRDNPLATSAGKSIGAGQGLTKIDAAEGVFVLFAAGLNQVALDRLSDDDSNPNSVFTRQLIPLLRTGGLSQVDLAKRIQMEVSELAGTIGHNQKPAYYDQIIGFVTLNQGKDEPPTEVAAIDPGTPDVAPDAPDIVPSIPGVALGAPDIQIGVAGPMTGPVCRIWRAAEARRRDGGRRDQRSGRRLGRQAGAAYRR